MIKNKPDFKLINCALIVLIAFLIYRTGNLWIGCLATIKKIIVPFFLAFIVAYALYPFLQYLMKRKIPKALAVVIIIALIIGIIAFLGITVIPLLFGQLSSLFNGIIAFIKEISLKYDINFGPLQDTLSNGFNDIIMSLGKYVSNGAINMIGVSMEYLSIAFIAFASAIYFLIDMDKIRAFVKKYLKRKNKKAFRYVSAVDYEMKQYLTGFLRIMLITLVEYSLVYTIIGHPDALLLGFLAMIANLIPYFGGMIANVVAAITSFVISPVMFIKTLIVFMVLSWVDGYLINPLVYGKTNKVHPLVGIFAVFAGGILFGIVGVIISLPLAIILITTYKFYWDDISDKIEDIKDKKD